MKIVTILSLLLFASVAYGELTKADLRTIIKEEVRPIVKEEITASEKRTREYIDLKIDALDQKLSAKIDGVEKDLNTRIDAVEKSLGRVWLMIAALIGLITATIAIPQIIIAYRGGGQKAMQAQIDRLRRELEAMQNTPS